MIRTRHVHKIIGDLSETPAAANSLLSRLKTIFKHAIKIGVIDINPTNDVDRYESKGGGYHTWTEEDIEAFERRHPVGSKAWFAAALMLYTGQRRCDAIEMGWNRVSGDLIGVRQIKTRKIVDIPLHPELEMAISSMPRSRESFLVTEFGKPFTSNGFGNWFRDRCDEAGLGHCSAHGLRKAAARRLAEAGCTNAEIKAITGHTTDQEVARYTAAVDRKRLARQAMEKTYSMSGELKVV
jgi:integrase